MLKDLWLSDAVSKDCYVLDELDLNDLTSGDLDDESFYTIRTSRLSNTQIEELNRLGFRFILSEVEFVGLVAPSESSDEGCKVRRAIEEDREEILNLAFTSFQHDRFHRDSLVSDRIANQIKRYWVAEAFSPESQKQLFVADEAGSVAGFCLAIPFPNESRIDLVAVGGPFRGRKIGTSLVKALPRLRGEPVISVRAGTQTNNVESLALYTKVNMIPCLERHVYHFGTL